MSEALETKPTELALTQTIALTGLQKLQNFFSNIEARLKQVNHIDAASMLSLKVVDAATAVQAKANKAAAKLYIGEVESLLDEPTSIAFQIHRSFTGLKSTTNAGALAVIEHADREVGRYSREQEVNREKLRRELQAQSDARALEQAEADAARLKAEQEARLAEAMPWEAEEIAIKPIQALPIAAPIVELAAVSVAPGFSKRYLPWTFEVTDFKALCLAVAEGRADINCIVVNQSFLTTAARYHKEKLVEHFPGVVGVHPVKDKF